MTAPKQLDAKRLFVRYSNSQAEPLFETNGVHLCVPGRNHPVLMLENQAKACTVYALGFDAYAGNKLLGFSERITDPTLMYDINRPLNMFKDILEHPRSA